MNKITRILLLSFLVSIILLVNNAYAEPGTSAESAVMISADTGKVVYSKNSNQQMSMASTTKIMTALITLEQNDLDAYFVVDENAIMVEGSSMGLLAGDQVSLRVLAYGMLLQSGNDAANAAAVYISGSLEAFAELMNEKAREIGMDNTNFVTPSGLDDKSHYSTAEDMAKLARYALKNYAFKEICSTYSTQVSYGNPPYDRWLKNHNRLLNEYDGAIGVKTGFTKKSGRCLVSAAERDGVCFIIVTLNASDDWDDHKALFDYGFSEVEAVTMPGFESTVKVTGGTEQKVTAVPYETPAAVLSDEELQMVEQKVSLLQFYYAPVSEGQVLGKLEYMYNNEVICSATLIAGSTVNEIEIEEEDEELSFFEKCKSEAYSIFDRIFSRNN